MRRALLLLALLAIAAAAVWTILRWNPARSGQEDPWSVIPDQAAVIIEVPDPWRTWDRFAHSSLLWRTWELRPGAAILGRTIARVNERVEADPALRAALGTAPMLVAFVRTGAGRADALFTSTCAPDGAAAIAGLFQIDAAHAQALADGAPTQVILEKEGTPMTVVVRDGIWLASANKELIDEALLQLERGTALTADPAFARARSTLGGGTDAHVLVHPLRAKGLFNVWWMPERLDALELPDAWVALDVRIQPDALLLSGLAIGAERQPLPLTLAQQGNGPWNIARVLPASVAQWCVWNVSDPRQVKASSEEALFPWVHGSAATAAAYATDGGVQRWLVLETDDIDAATEALTGMSGTDTLGYRGVRLGHMKEALPWETLMGQHTRLPQRPWWILLGHTVLMSEDPMALQASIDAWNDGNGLAEQKRVMEWFKRQAGDAAFTWWVDPARAQAFFREGMRTATDSAFTALGDLWSAHGGLCLQLSAAANGLTHVGIALQHAPGKHVGSNLLWTTDVGTPVERRPDLVLDHTNGTRGVLVQDTLHRVHLITSAGKLLWSRTLDGPILGAVHQVDRFKNGKLQLLLNTARTCYLIDRNAKDVGGFPIALRSPASAPLAVFDYDGQRDHRILIPVADGGIENFTSEAKPVEGWAPPRLSAPAIDAVHHLRVRNKDYLLVIDGDGGMKLLDRKGQERETVKARLERPKEILEVVPGSEVLSSRVRWIDQDLVLHETSLQGEELRTVPANGAHVQFLDIDGESAVARISNDSLIISNAKGAFFVKGHGQLLGPTASVHEMGGGMKAIAVRSREGRTWLYDTTGRLLSGMPVEGSSPCALGDLNLDGVMELVVAARKGVTAYRVPVE